MSKIRLYIIIIFILPICGIVNVYAQTEKVNYNNATLEKNGNRILNYGIKKQEEGSFLKSIEFFEKSFIIFEKTKNFKKKGDCNSYIALSFYYQGSYINALTYFEKSIKEYQKINYKSGVSSVTNNIGGIYFFLGNYPKALESYKKVLIVQKEIGEQKIVAATTQNIGLIYSKVEDYSNAMKYYKKAYSIYKNQKDEKAIAQNLNAMGFVYTKQNNYSKAHEFLSRALIIADKEKDKQIQIEILSNLGGLCLSQLNFQKALSYYTTCLKNSQDINSLQYIADSQIAIGKILQLSKEDKKAVQKCKSGLQIAEKIGSLPLKKDACDCLYQSYRSIGDTKKALIYYEKSNVFEDSLNAKETSNRMMNMEFQKQQLTDSLAYVKKEHYIELKHKEEVQKKEKQRNMIIISLGFIIVIAVGLWNRLNYVRKSREALKIEKDRSEKLLLNILPQEIAQELKEKGSVNARDFNLVSILFSDFKSFTQTAETMSPQNLVEEINVCFKAFDIITDKYNIEKIKTIGDSYMAAGGIPNPDKNSLKNIVLAGLEMQEFITNRRITNKTINKPAFEMRLGIHAGPIVAGIVGVKKFQYDVWGDTVNTASRIESNGMVGKVNISESLYDLIKNEKCFVFQYRGNIHAKGKGEIKMYFVEKNTMFRSKLPALEEHSYN